MPLENLWDDVGFTPNSKQEQAIHHIAGPLHLPAGPGSGKTRVLLWRTVNLIVFHGVKPDEIFLSTFTEKAALQLKEGLRSLLAVASRHTWPACTSAPCIPCVGACCWTAACTPSASAAKSPPCATNSANTYPCTGPPAGTP